MREKTYGKQKVYLIDQSGLSEATPEELRAMDIKVEELEKAIKEGEAGCKHAQSELKDLTSSLTTEEAKAQAEAVRVPKCFFVTENLLTPLVAEDALCH